MASRDHDIDPFKLSSPRIFLVRMLVFLVLLALLAFILYRQIWQASCEPRPQRAYRRVLIASSCRFAMLRLFPEITSLVVFDWLIRPRAVVPVRSRRWRRSQ
jgi:hypothetical protein